MLTGVVECYRTNRMQEEWEKLGGTFLQVNPKHFSFESTPQGLKQLSIPELNQGVDAIFDVGYHNYPELSTYIKQLVDGGATLLSGSTMLQPQHQSSAINRYQVLSTIEAPVPKTYFTFKDAADQIIPFLEFPVIIKNLETSRKKGVYKADNEGQYNKIIGGLDSNTAPIAVKQYIPHKREHRVVVIDYKVEAILTRTGSNNEFLGAFTESAKREAQNIDEYKELCRIATACSEALNYNYVGFDILEDDNGNYWVVDINKRAMFEITETITGVNIAEKICALLWQS